MANLRQKSVVAGENSSAQPAVSEEGNPAISTLSSRS
jgi:hypothetical protein